MGGDSPENAATVRGSEKTSEPARFRLSNPASETPGLGREVINTTKGYNMKQPEKLSTAIDTGGTRLLWHCPECGQEVTKLVPDEFGMHFKTFFLPTNWLCGVCSLGVVNPLSPILARRFSI